MPSMLRADTYRWHIRNRVRAGNTGSPWLNAMTRSESARRPALAVFRRTVRQVLRRRGALSEADGAVPPGTTVFAEIPAVANLDPVFLDALRRAAKDAANDGVEFRVNSGWRSPAYQNQLRHKAIAKYGSEQEAARWVATADRSAHVLGNAIDLGPAEATSWLSKHGAAYGLCQIYRNEPWHYELRPEAIDQGCPPMYADPSQDPRLQR
ncbi:peptidase M15 [Amycolatopsis sp. A1MSW2902]